MLTLIWFKFSQCSGSFRYALTIFVRCEISQLYVNVCQYHIIYLLCTFSWIVCYFICQGSSVITSRPPFAFRPSIIVSRSPSSSFIFTWCDRRTQGYRWHKTGNGQRVRGLSGTLKTIAGPQLHQHPERSAC